MARPPGISDYERNFFTLGAKPAHVRRIWRAWIGAIPWEAPQHVNYPAALLVKIPEIRASLESLLDHRTVQSKQQAESVKLLLRLSDGALIESVLLPREALCVSTQVGCAVGCVFCMTGKGGLERQLSSAEIVAQFVAACRVRPGIRKVVFMGMGEPSHNLQAVKEAVHFLGEVAGLAHKQIVISTVGDERLFDAIESWRVKPALALSLHSTDVGKRASLLTKAPRIAPEALLEKTLSYAERTKYPAQIEWTLMAGVNDGFEEAERLASLMKGRLGMVNFIAINDTGASFTRPARAHIEALITVLRKEGVVATFRDSAAQDIEGGCGQLRARRIAICKDENACPEENKN